MKMEIEIYNKTKELRKSYGFTRSDKFYTILLHIACFVFYLFGTVSIKLWISIGIADVLFTYFIHWINSKINKSKGFGK